MEKRKKRFDWIAASNRPKHLVAGILVFFGQISVAMFANDIFSYYFSAFVVSALSSVIIAMTSVEFIQKQGGGKFDWLDILAGCLIPLICTLILVL